MGTQQLPLCWNSHQTEILTTFQRLLLEESLVDVTLACEGISLKAHKTILSACSPFFQDLFLENPCKHPIVIMKDIKYRDLKGIVDFMYHGGISVAPDQLSEFLKTAEALKVKGLSEHSTILDLNKHLKIQEKSPQKITGFQQSLPSCVQDKHLVEASIREENALWEQQPNIVADFITGSENDAHTIEDETNTFNIKSEPEPNDDSSCEEVLPEHTMSDDSLLSVHYDERFVPHMEITEVDQDLILVPEYQQEQGIVTSETLPDTTSPDAVLPLEHISSAESLGIVISPDVTDNPEPIMHCTSFEHCNVTVSNQDVKPIALMSYEEPSVYCTSDQLDQKYNSTDLKVKRTADVSEQRIFISSEQEGNRIRMRINHVVSERTLGEKGQTTKRKKYRKREIIKPIPDKARRKCKKNERKQNQERKMRNFRKSIKDMSKQEQKLQRRKWREASKRLRDKKKALIDTLFTNQLHCSQSLFKSNEQTFFKRQQNR